MSTSWMNTLVADAKPEEAPLSLPQGDLGLTIGELAGNEAAVRLLVNSYRRYADENVSLRNEANTLRTYVMAYESIRTNSMTGAVLLAMSNISVGFGVGLLAGGRPGPAGWYSLLVALGLVGAGLYFCFFKDRR